MFEDRSDIRYFLSLLARLVRAGRLEVHSYSVLSTHFHLLVRSPLGELSAAMQWLLNLYVRWFNRSRRRDGPLMRGRFVSKRAESLTYRRHLVRYIDFNPVAAGLASSPALYPHGSAADYARGYGRPWLSRDWVGAVVRSESGGGISASAYAQIFGEPLSPGLARWIEARMRACSDVHDPLDDLLDAAPPAVLAWMRCKALLADGTDVGPALCDASELELLLRDRIEAEADPDTLLAGLLRDLSGDSMRHVAARLRTSISTAARWTLSHRAKLATDEAYADRATTLAQAALRELHGRVGPERCARAP